MFSGSISWREPWHVTSAWRESSDVTSATCYMLHAHALFVPFFSLILSFILSHEPETSSNLSSREHNCPVVVCTQLRDYYNISGVNTFSFIKFYLTWLTNAHRRAEVIKFYSVRSLTLSWKLKQQATKLNAQYKNTTDQKYMILIYYISDLVRKMLSRQVEMKSDVVDYSDSFF